MADQGQRTEKATPRRIQKARREGQFLTSRHLVGGIQFLLSAALLSSFFGSWYAGIAQLLRAFLRRAASGELNSRQLVDLTREAMLRGAGPLAAAGVAVVLAVIAGQLMITRFGFSFKKLAFDPARLNPFSKMKNMVHENLMSFVQATVLIPVFLYAVYQLFLGNLDAYLALPKTNAAAGAVWVASLIDSLMWKASGVFLVFGFLDYARERQKYTRNLRMSKQEIKDELKETEGNIEMKARIKRLLRSLNRKRMLRDVKTATAVVVNPTHFAVALRYEPGSVGAPLVVAKGKNHLALRIRALATEHQVPIVENPPLARGLYEAVEVGQEIPLHLYRAVAEILAHVFKLMSSYGPMSRP